MLFILISFNRYKIRRLYKSTIFFRKKIKFHCLGYLYFNIFVTDYLEIHTNIVLRKIFDDKLLLLILLIMISIIHISDIHYGRVSDAEENQGAVLKGFIDDLCEQMKECDITQTLLVISGDLVHTGKKENYDNFYDNFICKIHKRCRIPLSNMIFVPGNHDLSRDCVEENYYTYKGVFDNSDFRKEEDFNSYINSKEAKKVGFLTKFDDFKLFYSKFPKEKCITDLSAYTEIVFDKLNVLCLNTALCSLGGYNNISDTNLNINTRQLWKWLDNDGPGFKILVMHHPINELSSWAQKALNTILAGGKINLMLTGHIHNQKIDARFIDPNVNLCIHCQAPQLFSDKNDLLGYSIINLDETELCVTDIKYREWHCDHARFLTGVSFSGTNDGIKHFKKCSDDRVSKKSTLENENGKKKPETAFTLSEDDKRRHDLKSFLNTTEFPVHTPLFVQVIRSIEELKDIAQRQPDLRENIFLFFCNYIKKRAAYPKGKEQYMIENSWLSLDSKTKTTSSPSYDIQLIFNIIYKDCHDIFEDFHGDFSYTILQNVHWVGLRISNANFSNCFLEHANMYCDIQKNIFSEFKNCNFDGAYLDAANMNQSDFSGSTFVNTKLRWANLWGCTLTDVVFKLTDMTGVILSKSKIKNCQFEHCILDASELNEIDFLSKTTFGYTSFCFASIFSEQILDGKFIDYIECNWAGAETDAKNFFKGNGRIKRLLLYKSNIKSDDKVAFKSTVRDTMGNREYIEYKKKKYMSIIKIFKEYCLTNNNDSEKNEISAFQNDSKL